MQETNTRTTRTRQLLETILATCDFERCRDVALEYMAEVESSAIPNDRLARVDRFILAVEGGRHLERLIDDKLAVLVLLSNIDVFRMRRLLDAAERHIPGYGQSLCASREAALPQAIRFDYRMRYLMKIQRICRLYRNRFRIRDILKKYGRPG